MEQGKNRLPNGRFPAGVSGNPAGRKPGLKDRRSERKEGLFALIEYGARGDRRKGTKALPPRHERIRELLTSPDHNVRLATERFFFEHDFGRAKQSVDVFHHSAAIDEADELMRESGTWDPRAVEEPDAGQRVQ